VAQNEDGTLPRLLVTADRIEVGPADVAEAIRRVGQGSGGG
jgi:hypothetical protein